MDSRYYLWQAWNVPIIRHYQHYQCTSIPYEENVPQLVAFIESIIGQNALASLGNMTSIGNFKAHQADLASGHLLTPGPLGRSAWRFNAMNA